MKKYILAVALVLIPGFVCAHVVVSPKTVTPNSYHTFIVGVPSERAAATTKVRLVIPFGVVNVTPTVKSGWSIDLLKVVQGTSTVVREITWSGGSVPAGFREEFSFSAKTPGVGTLSWKAYQTYSDGIEVSWDAVAQGAHNHESPQGPASVTTIASSTSAHGSHSNQTHHSFLIALLALGLSVLALNEIVNLQKRN